MITCPDCKIGLHDSVRRCPVCGRGLRMPPWAPAILAVGLVVALALGLYGSGKIKNKLVWGQTTAADAYAAARGYVEKESSVRGAATFGNLSESVVERWDAKRWRVSGFVDSKDKSGAKWRTRYYCVVRYNGNDHWAVEDLQLERVR